MVSVAAFAFSPGITIASELTTVVVSGDAVPGIPEELVFEAAISGAVPTISRNGIVALVLSTDENTRGTWTFDSATGGPLSLFGLTGDPVAGPPDELQFTSLQIYAIDNQAALSFRSSLGMGSGSAGVALGAKNALAAVAYQGEEAPGFEPLNFNGSMSHPALSPSGDLVFSGRVSSMRGAWYQAQGSSLDVLLGPNLPAPGLPPGNTIAEVNDEGVNNIPINAHGTAAVYVQLTVGGDVTFDDDLAIYKGTPGALEIAIRKGTPVAGLPRSGRIDDFVPRFSLNDDGDMAVWVVADENHTGIVSLENNILGLLAAEGDVAPGMDAGEVFESNSGSPFAIPIISTSGETYFSSLVSPGSGSATGFGIWKGTASTGPSIIARDGDPVDPLLPGVVIGAINIDNYVVAPEGSVIFQATLSGKGVDGSNNLALLRHDPSDGLSVVAREGDLLEVRAGDFRMIDGFEFSTLSNGLDGRPSSVCATAFVFRLTFDDASSGVFLLDLRDCITDFNGDGLTNGADLATLLSVWGSDSPIGDLNGDGIVDGGDLATLLANWGLCDS